MELFIKQKLYKFTHTIAFTTIFVLLAFGSLTFAQTKEKGKKEDCKDSKKSEKVNKLNNKKVQPKRVQASSNFRVRPQISSNANRFRFGFTNSFQLSQISEKSINVHPKAYISLCVVQGSIKVNGWDRNEVRLFVEGKGSEQVGFKVREVEKREKMPVWIQVLEFDPKPDVESNYNTCLSGNVELDVPRNATIKIENNKGESETSIDTVRAAKVEVLGGDIYLNNVSELIDAQTYKGGVTVRNSSGKMVLSTISGNIIAYNTSSSEIGDFLKAKTRSGAITMQSVDQKEVESSTISGSINYIGNIKPFGRYEFSTTNGSINLAIPKESSCQLIAAYGGSFQSELPLNDLFKERSESLVFLKAKMGKGEANLNLKSFKGAISIRERNEFIAVDLKP